MLNTLCILHRSSTPTPTFFPFFQDPCFFSMLFSFFFFLPFHFSYPLSVEKDPIPPLQCSLRGLLRRPTLIALFSNISFPLDPKKTSPITPSRRPFFFFWHYFSLGNWLPLSTPPNNTGVSSLPPPFPRSSIRTPPFPSTLFLLFLVSFFSLPQRFMLHPRPQLLSAPSPSMVTTTF